MNAIVSRPFSKAGTANQVTWGEIKVTPALLFVLSGRCCICVGRSVGMAGRYVIGVVAAVVLVLAVIIGLVATSLKKLESAEGKLYGITS